jgi:hypothetical protein
MLDEVVPLEVIAQVAARLDVHRVTVGQLSAIRAPEVIAWLKSDEAEGSHLSGAGEWLFTDLGTAMAFKLRFG